jgi:hypothetical protein
MQRTEFVGLLLAAIPDARPVALALAWLASLGAAVALLVLGYWIAFRWLAVETFGSRESTQPDPALSWDEWRWMNWCPAYSPEPATTEPDPLESDPTGILDIKKYRATLAPGVWIHHPGELPVPLNPIGPSQPETRMRS